ncbi:MAG: murein biosynthesis integral membrane protein MurJ [Blastocatellia bacterium]
MSKENQNNNQPTEKTPSQTSRKDSSAGALLVATGIFLSRIAGLVRERIFASYFGNSDAGDAFKSAQKIPNFLQNLFGEGVLSASFIPVYSGLLAKEQEEEANRLAGVVASLLTLITTILVLLGIYFTPLLIDLISPGFEGAKRLLTIRLVQIFFPGTGLLVLSAWCLGILNSHRKFFLSYVAPVVWNVAQIAALLAFGGSTPIDDLAIKVGWALVIGSALQFVIQLPVVFRLIKRLHLGVNFRLDSVREVIKNFFPVVIARGVVQISSYTDNLLASLLPTGAVSSITYAQILYTLPVSLFGMSVSAAELPAMSSAVGTTEEIAEILRKKLNNGLQQIAFFVIPSAIAFLALGDIVVATIYQTGKFSASDTKYVWVVLAAFSVGLLAATLGRLYSSTFYALLDTRTPLKFAVVRISLSIILGIIFALKMPSLLGIDKSWGTVGIALAAAISGWLELFLLRQNLSKRIGKTALGWAYGAKLWSSAIFAALVALGVKLLIGSQHPVIAGVLILAPYGVTYFVLTTIFGIPQTRSITKRVERFLPSKLKRFLPKN